MLFGGGGAQSWWFGLVDGALRFNTIYLIQLVEFLPAAALLKVMKRPCACLAWKPSYIVVASGFFFVTHQPIDRRFLAYTTASGHAFQGVVDRQWHLREDFQRILVSNA